MPKPFPFLKFADRLAHTERFERALLDALCSRCIAALKAKTPGRDLPNEWHSTISKTESGLSATLTSKRYDRDDADWELILFWQDHGTRKHGPVTAPMLHWIDRDTGDHIWAKEVKGVPAAYFSKACDEEISAFLRTIPQQFVRYIETGKLPS